MSRASRDKNDATPRHFPAVPSPLFPITPFLHEADALMDNLLDNSCDEARKQEVRMVEYYCISHALWLSHHVHTPDEKCIEFLCCLTSWQERLKQHPARTFLDSRHLMCENFGSISMLCDIQLDNYCVNARTSGEFVIKQCCTSTGPATASLVIFENERHAPFVGWSHKHLLPYERGHFSNETGSVRSTLIHVVHSLKHR